MGLTETDQDPVYEENNTLEHGVKHSWDKSQRIVSEVYEMPGSYDSVSSDAATKH